MAANQTVLLKGNLARRYEEALAFTTVKPGYGLEKRSDGKVQPQSTSVGRWDRTVAIENSYYGKTKDDAYAANEIVKYLYLDVGDVVNVILAASQTVTKGDKIVMNGDGSFKKVVAPTTDFIVGEAQESVTTTGATGWLAIVVY